MKRMIITPAQLNEILTEDFDSRGVKKIQKRIYKAVSGFCGKMHSDSGWQDVGELIDIIRSVDGVEDVHVGAGEYFNFTNPEDGAYRDYETTVLTSSGKLYGYIRCHAAGTMDDPFRHYDMTISLYPDKKRDVEERLESINETTAAFTYGENEFSEKLADFKNANPGTNPVETPVIGVNTGDTATGTPTTDTTKANTAKQTIITANTGTSSALANMEESRRYSKRQVELGRMLEMRRTGKVYSKKQLNEIFEEDAELEERLRDGLQHGNIMIHDLFDAVGEYLGSDAESNLKECFSCGDDLEECLVELFNETDTDTKEEFLDSLGI